MEASHRLAALTDDLLDTTRLQANRLELRPEPLEMGALVRRVVRRQRLAADRHTIAMTLPPETEPLLVEADMQRLEQVLTNLLSNSIKYSPQGGTIEVEVGRSVHTEAAAGTITQWAQVAVRDHGIGIPADQFDRMFSRFGRATNAHERGITGTGLGLYLCRELIERQGGRIWFESTEGVGTTFTFELPGWTAPE
jgi:signal transduction histidine kinase